MYFKYFSLGKYLTQKSLSLDGGSGEEAVSNQRIDWRMIVLRIYLRLWIGARCWIWALMRTVMMV